MFTVTSTTLTPPLTPVTSLPLFDRHRRAFHSRTRSPSLCSPLPELSTLCILTHLIYPSPADSYPRVEWSSLLSFFPLQPPPLTRWQNLFAILIFFVIFRESLEAALIVAILLGL